jgi:hypothetical protein
MEGARHEHGRRKRQGVEGAAMRAYGRVKGDRECEEQYM